MTVSKNLSASQLDFHPSVVGKLSRSLYIAASTELKACGVKACDRENVHMQLMQLEMLTRMKFRHG